VTAAQHVFDRSPCGALHVQVHSAVAALRPSGALWLQGSRALIAGDLHLEKGSAYASRGQMLPPYDTRDTLNRLSAEVEATDPAIVVFLGDTLHDGGAQERIARDDILHLAAIARGRTLLWVVGNHDPDGPGELPGEAVDELLLEGLILRHEPLPGDRPGEVSGHLHPCARVVGAGRSVRRRCFVTDGRRLILPAFGAYAGGLNIRDEAFAGLFRHAPLIGALGTTRVHAVGWRSTRRD
jgi:DNA ligase-associated metallophosphoesterase